MKKKKGKVNSECTIAAVLFNCPVSSSAVALLFYFLFVLCALSLPLILSDTTVLLFISAEFSCCSFRCTHTHRHTFEDIKQCQQEDFSWRPVLLVCCIILAVLKENLCSHTYSVTLSLAPLSPPENWISTTVVLCDVPVPDKSLMSLGACK